MGYKFNTSELHDLSNKYADQFNITSGEHNGERDAFRHAFSSAILARDHGISFAENAGIGWEIIGLLNLSSDDTRTFAEKEAEARMENISPKSLTYFPYDMRREISFFTIKVFSY
ncbi:MAG: hypothetical protein Q4B71_06240 [Cardiobacteriaceae bacterium]|nr:hypothetical protein [Cardiobacteriaceae bacterium]